MDKLQLELSELKLQFEEYVKKTDGVIAKLEKEQKKMTKQTKKLVKESDEQTDKPKRLNGFAKPMRMSPELCQFLNVDTSTEMARTDVTKKITEYVKEHKLQNEKNKRELILDDKLRTIIQPEEDVQVTFFNLQKFLSKHYYKPEEVAEKPAELPVTPKSVKVIKKPVKK